jgi:hypothetical protein
MVIVTGGGGGIAVTVIVGAELGVEGACVTATGEAGVALTGVAPVANEHPGSVTAASAAAASRMRRGFFAMSLSLS